jgi:hypothetical protein
MLEQPKLHQAQHRMLEPQQLEQHLPVQLLVRQLVYLMLEPPKWHQAQHRMLEAQQPL